MCPANFSTRTRLVLRQHNSIHDMQGLREPLNFSPPKLLFIVGIHEFCQTQSTESEICFRQLDGSVVWQVVLIHGIVVQSIVDISNVSSLWFRINFCDISNNCLTLFEVGVLGGTEIQLLILSKMYRSFQSCRHTDSPDHRVDVDLCISCSH